MKYVAVFHANLNYAYLVPERYEFVIRSSYELLIDTMRRSTGSGSHTICRHIRLETPRVIHLRRPVDRFAEVRLERLTGCDLNQAGEDLESWGVIAERSTKHAQRLTTPRSQCAGVPHEGRATTFLVVTANARLDRSAY
jgi:hypothetical protein